MQGQQGGLDVRPGATRPTTRVPGGVLRHAFSAGAHYDPANTSFGPLVLHDEVRLEPGAGFPEHAHAGVVVVTHVVEGSLRHRDVSGADTVLGPGDTGVMSAGPGLVHAEHAGPDGCWYLQSFLLDASPAPHAVHRGADEVRCAGYALHVLRLAAHERHGVPGSRVHLHVVQGRVALDGVQLTPGDAVRARGGIALQAAEPSLAVCWTLPG